MGDGTHDAGRGDEVTGTFLAGLPDVPETRPHSTVNL